LTAYELVRVLACVLWRNYHE